MCLFCVTENFKNLTINEIKSNGSELINSSKNEEEVNHIIERILAILEERNK